MFFPGRLVVKQIYNFIVQHFPFFDINEPSGWKNSIRHTLIQKKFFDHTIEEAPTVQPNLKINSNGKTVGRVRNKGRVSYSYAIVPEKYERLIQSVTEACLKNEKQVKKAMAKPELFETFINDGMENQK